MGVIEFPPAATNPDEDLTEWIRVVADVRVAYSHGMFGGMIVEREDGFAACDLFGRDRGVFATASEARVDLETMLARPAVRAWLDGVTTEEATRGEAS